MITTDTEAAPAKAGAPARGASLRDTLVDAVDVEIETYLGGARMSIGELKALANGSVVALDCPLNATVELRVNGIVIARGELVAVGEKFGVRITTLAP